MTEQERLYLIYKPMGMREGHIEEFLDLYSKTDEPPENALTLLKVALAITLCVPEEFTLDDYVTFCKSNSQIETARREYEELKEILILGAKYRESHLQIWLIAELNTDSPVERHYLE